MKGSRGVTLIELLCVIAIISILAALLLPSLSRGYRRAQILAEETEVSEVADRLRRAVRNYCAAHTNYQFNTKADLVKRCRLEPKCQAWIEKSRTTFIPFNHLDATNKVVISFNYGRNYSQTENFTKEELTITE